MAASCGSDLRSAAEYGRGGPCARPFALLKGSSGVMPRGKTEAGKWAPFAILSFMSPQPSTKSS